MYIAIFIELAGVQAHEKNRKRRPLSDTVLANLEPELKEYRELDGEGLYFRVKPDGKKAGLFRYKRLMANGHGLVLALTQSCPVKVQEKKHHR